MLQENPSPTSISPCGVTYVLLTPRAITFHSNYCDKSGCCLDFDLLSRRSQAGPILEDPSTRPIYRSIMGHITWSLRELRSNGVHRFFKTRNPP